MKRIAGLLLITLAIAPAMLARTRAIGPRTSSWRAPNCASITGLDWFRFIDKSRSPGLVGPKQFEDQNVYPLAVAASAIPNVMYAALSNGAILQSNDAGCTWRERARVPEAFENQRTTGIEASAIAPVYAWSGDRLIRLTFGTVETLALPENIVEIEANPQHPTHLRAISAYGRAFESFDGGSNWQKVGDLTFNTIADAEFSPANFDHIVATVYPGTVISKDGGKTWTHQRQSLSIVDLAFAPSDPNVLWADAIDPNTNRHGVYRSTDEGRTFTRVVLTNQVRYARESLAAHPLDSTKVVVAQPHTPLRIISANGNQEPVESDGVQEALWSPIGTLYYFNHVIQSR